LSAARSRLTSAAESRAGSEKRLKAVAPASGRAKHGQKKNAHPEMKAKDTKDKRRAARPERPVHETAATGHAETKPVESVKTKRTTKSVKVSARSAATAVEAPKVSAVVRPTAVAGSSLSSASTTLKERRQREEREEHVAVQAMQKAQPNAQNGEGGSTAAPTVSAAPANSTSHTGHGDATLARYMSELAGYELLGRDDEIRLAQEVERLEVAYWVVMLGLPRAIDALEPVIRTKLEEDPTELAAVVKAARAARASDASKTARVRYTRAVERAAEQLRALDIHREAAKAAHDTAQEFADSPQAGRSTKGGHPKVIDTYLQDIESARRAQQMAKDRFVAANLRLVVSMARRYAREGRMPLADLIQEGNLGLMKAVERFDHRRGFRFSTYASWWIRHALTRGLADKGRLVRLPVHALETRTRLARATRKLTCRTGVAPTLAELAAETGLTPEKLTAVEELSTEAPFSLDAPVGGDNDRTFLDMLRYEDQTTAEDSVVSESHKESLASLMGELSPFEAQILRYRYGFDGGEERTLKEIGQMYNLSRERIRQIQACALAKMRARVEDAEGERAAL